MKGFEAHRAMRLTNAQRAGAVKLFSSARIHGDDMSIAIRLSNVAAGQLISPHTAVGLAASRLIDLVPAFPLLTLSTSHPSPFPSSLLLSLFFPFFSPFSFLFFFSFFFFFF